MNINDGTYNNRMFIMETAERDKVRIGGYTPTNNFNVEITPVPAMGVGVTQRAMSTFAPNDAANSVNGGTQVLDTTTADGDGSFGAAFINLYLGGDHTGNQNSIFILAARYFGGRNTNAELETAVGN